MTLKSMFEHIALRHERLLFESSGTCAPCTLRARSRQAMAIAECSNLRKVFVCSPSMQMLTGLKREEKGASRGRKVTCCARNGLKESDLARIPLGGAPVKPLFQRVQIMHEKVEEVGLGHAEVE